MAEREGFEPSNVKVDVSGFQDRYEVTKPSGAMFDPSVRVVAKRLRTRIAVKVAVAAVGFCCQRVPADASTKLANAKMRQSTAYAANGHQPVTK